MDIAFIGRLTKVDYILHNAPTSRVRNPDPYLEHANQRGEAKPYNGIAFKLMCITECVISCVENGTLWIICFSKKYKLYRVV